MVTISDPLTLLQEDCGDISGRSCDVIGEVGDAQCLDEDVVSLLLHSGLLHFADSLIDMKIKRKFSVMEKSDILLDIDTARNKIIISEDLRSASYTATSQNRPDGPKRFTSCQVFSSRSFSSGRHYWEVDVSRAERWLIGVAGQSLERKVAGNESFIGYNSKSWALTVNPGFGASHNKVFQSLVSASPVQAVGIHLDYEAGRLSFYKLCDPIRHLHTFTASFTEPLYAAFFVFADSSIRIMK
ncbi:tripartite motif-containing protein 60-like [Eleutherodactylus coqui]|uniref:tripartite motif-containing protein 60-like n=1 Tax=Eleutherodactylus coqui TaxID=57060 RepID=UPI003463830A